MAGVTTDVCLYFPVISALAEDYEVYAVYDASGCWDMMSELTSCMRLQQAGAIVCNWAVVAAMLQWDWRRDTARGTLDHVFVETDMPLVLTSSQEDHFQGLADRRSPGDRTKGLRSARQASWGR